MAEARPYNGRVKSPGRAHLSVISLAAIALGGLAAWGFFNYVRAPRLTPELRGYELAERLGCHGCHGPRGTGGVPNPRADDGEIPAWDGGNAMMYVKNESEIREWILDGRPWRLTMRDSLAARSAERDSAFPKPGEVNLRPRPLARIELPVRMPAFRGVVTERELTDLVAYYKAVAVFGEMPDSVHAGYRAARELGCFGCHGPGGLVGARNPRSFKGYIPPWRGNDFRELVQDDDELRTWILDGSIPRLTENRVARWFMTRQVVGMPAYRGVAADSSLASIVGYIRWLSETQPE